MIYIDACAIVSMISAEPDATIYAEALEADSHRITSIFAMWESAFILARPGKLDASLDSVAQLVREWLAARGVDILGGADALAILEGALYAARRYGVGRRKLSTFDCFHYGCARANNASLLTLDKPLRETDIECVPEIEGK